MGSFQDIQGATEWQKAENSQKIYMYSFHILQKWMKEGGIYEKPSDDNLRDYKRSLNNLMSDKVSIS